MTQAQDPVEKKSFSEKAKQYYRGKKMWSRYFVLIILLLLVAIQLLGQKNKINPISTDIFTKTDYEQINFATEVVPFGGEYFFNTERLDREVTLVQLNTAQFVMIHKRELQYLSYIKGKLKTAGIPEDFMYLPVIESALRNVSYSSAGAAGIWQFMPATAERYGLLVNDSIDERLDFEKSTEAAIVYLQDLYERFGNRTLVAAAYNRGENGLQRDMARQDVDNFYDLWLNEETSRYIFRILATKEIMENRFQYFPVEVLGDQYPLPSTKIIKVGEVADIALWAREQGFSYDQIRRLNPRIVGNLLPEGKREVKVFKK